MRDERVRMLLRRIALGLPIALGSVVSSGCEHCFAFPEGGSSHPRSALTESMVGTPERFDGTNCSALCRVLDGPNDAAAVGDAMGDAGMPFHVPDGRNGPIPATCSYSADGTVLVCSYVDRFCEISLGPTPAYGRTPAGLVTERSLATSPVARWLAEGAHLEAASVPAFEDLAAELEAFGAPRQLVRAARLSAADERRHARALDRLAHRLGAPVAAVRRVETALRGPEEVAHDNAVEGCVREAYGAIAAAFQAQNAKSLAVRQAYRVIAKDEARHALLSFAANDWLSPRLSRAARRRTEEARREGLAHFAAALEREPERMLHDVLGLPDATRGVELVSLLG